jgi:hypothetical protein
MISQKELAKLYSYLSNENQTFEQIIKSFNEEFNIESRNKAINSIIILLKDNMLNLSQRIISYFILYNIPQKENTEANPFLFIILEQLKNSNDEREQDFLIDFLYKKINYLKMTIKQYLSQSKREMRINLTQMKLQWDKYYKEILAKNNINVKSNDKIRAIIYDRGRIDINNQNVNNITNYNGIPYVNILNQSNLNYFNIDYMCFRPINNNFVSSEPVILIPNLRHNFIWEKEPNILK